MLLHLCGTEETCSVSGTSRRAEFLETVTRVMESLITHTPTRSRNNTNQTLCYDRILLVL